MWSIYDTCILISGVIIAAIAVVPVSGVGEERGVVPRWWAAD